MKKLRLKRWVKVTLVALVLVSLLIFSEIHYRKGVEQCVNAGHSQKYCENVAR